MGIIFLTGNQGKLKTANNALQPYGIVVTNQKIEIPEIQSLDVEDVAKFSAKYGSDMVKSDVIVTDVGYYIKALNGFPGPFIKFLNKTLTGQDVIDLMQRHEDRSLEIRECLAYCRYGQEPICFTSRQFGTIVKDKPTGLGSTIDNVLKMDGFTTTVGNTPFEVMAEYWVRDLSHYKDFANHYLKSID